MGNLYSKPEKPQQDQNQNQNMQSTKIPEEQSIAVDTDADDSGNESLGSTGEYSTVSLTSSIYEYRYENGRRYQSRQAGQYLLPNDEVLLPDQCFYMVIYMVTDKVSSVTRLNKRVTDGRLTLAPIENPQNVLDVGTGTGIWAIDMADKYPSAHVIGTDLSPIQPSWVPPNVDFQIDDAELDWTFKKDSFDLVHIRHLAGGIRDWDHLLKEAYNHCKPGGYIEVSEYEMTVGSDDGTCHEKMAIWQFYDLVDKASIQSGRDFRIAKVLKPVLEKAGFINVEHQAFKIPLGTWPADKKQKEIGAYTLLSAESGFEAFGMDLFTNILGMNVEDARTLINECRASARSRKVHSYSTQ